MKKISILFLSLIVLITLTACDMVDKSSDAYRFKEEYESINGEENGHGNKNRSLEIPIDNPMIYASTDEIIEKMNNKESFVVYFGFASCPWCRSMVESLIQSAKCIIRL